MAMKRLLGMLLLLAGPAAAEELRYDNGTVRGYFQNLLAGQAEAMRLTTEHPATLTSIWLRFSEPGPVEIHVWRENGDHRAWFDHDYITPIQTVVPQGGIVEITLDPPVEICAECDFHVGHVLLADDGPSLAVDSSETDETRALLWDFNEGVWYSVGEDVGGTLVYRYYMVRAQVEYHDIITDKLFTDVTEETGFGTPSDISAVDYDLDGDVDVLQNSRLLRNDDGVFTDVSTEVGLDGYQSVSGGVFADYDRDGDLDLFLFVSTCCDETEAGGVHDHLLRNDDGVFVDVTDTAGTFDWRPNRSAAWGDYNGDGYPDLFLSGYERPGSGGVPTGNSLFRNNGDGTFSDYTSAARIDFVTERTSRTVTWADYDQDGLLDLYVGAYRLQVNYLFHNLGGYFEEVGAATNTAGIRTSGYYGHTIGAEWGDTDNDGDLDLVVMNLAHTRFLDFSDLTKIYLNPLESGSVEFQDVREQVGVAYDGTAFDPALGDYDNDGDLDLFTTSVYVGRKSWFYQNQLREEGALRYQEISYPAGARVDNGHAVIWADFDNDGDLDLLSNRLFRNDSPAGNWLKVRLVGGDGQDTFGIGATVTLEAGDLKIMRLVSAGVAEGSQKPFELHFGLGDNQSYDSITVNWLGGYIDRHPCGQANQRLVLTQGEILAPDCQEEEPDAGVADGGDAGDAGDGGGDVAGDLGGSTGGGGCGCGGSGGTPWLALGLLLLLRRSRS
jgi:hypothetical protein